MYWQALDPRLWTSTIKIVAAVSLVLVLVLGGVYLRQSGYNQGYSAAEYKGKVELSEFKERIRTLLDAQVKAQREYELALEARVGTIQKDKENEIKSINDRYLALADSVRKRGSRPTGTSAAKDPSAAPADSNGTRCTGGELYREDAEFLAREALRADVLQKALVACRKMYEALLEKEKTN